MAGGATCQVGTTAIEYCQCGSVSMPYKHSTGTLYYCVTRFITYSYKHITAGR